MNSELRKNCPMRHECGNCLPAGGFCTAVNNPICEALHNAYDTGWRAALQQEEGPTFLSLDDPEAVAIIEELTERMMRDGLVKVSEVTGSGENEPQTNADAIRAMSDEELAEHLTDWQDWGGGLSPEMWLEWLRQPKEAKC